MRDSHLLDFETDFILPVATYKASFCHAIQQILDASPLGVCIKETDAAEYKADSRAS